ncbi:hypothetical protein E0493_16210 [Roseomonas sp. M0104]|uniref:Uncharacterized protein n=1 Tax=Teichococcus coralli TaxID=2545983 RepID=A0A845BHW5_9PROT|nr:hypothetical protein [Pseudoroseomonas coralli]MXP64897.1 hypothetical protein [Pseudoroseomonas coralli]
MAGAITDHATLRRWAESHGDKPAATNRTRQEGETGIIRILFPRPRRPEHGARLEISWDEFFRQFDESKLALPYERDSLLNRIIGRDTMECREHHAAHRQE